MIIAATLQCRTHIKASGGYPRAGEPQEGRGQFWLWAANPEPCQLPSVYQLICKPTFSRIATLKVSCPSKRSRSRAPLQCAYAAGVNNPMVGLPPERRPRKSTARGKTLLIRCAGRRKWGHRFGC